MEVIKNQVYKHFKGNLYKVIEIGLDAESLEEKVIYKGLNDSKIWIRSYNEFISKVDKIKYPDSTQEYRFEILND